jgi:hypothetical protein
LFPFDRLLQTPFWPSESIGIDRSLFVSAMFQGIKVNRVTSLLNFFLMRTTDVIVGINVPPPVINQTVFIAKMEVDFQVRYKQEMCLCEAGLA